LRHERHHRRWQVVRTFVLGVVAGVIALVALAMLANPHP